MGRRYIEFVHPDDIETTNAIATQIMAGVTTKAFTNRYMHRDGTAVPVMWSAAWSDEHQTMFAVARDMREHQAAEEKLRQAQKMEAVGQLTGGVAHDFNNLLTIVIGSAEMLVEGLADQPELEPLAHLVLDTAERGADLVSRLLAFSRQQPLVPQTVNCAALFRSLTPLLQRTIGSNIKIHLAAPDSLYCLADPTHLTSALLNLCINARDAMPEGGRLIVGARLDRTDIGERASSEPANANLVVLTVRDTGEGMTEAVIKRVIEPFFTTKAVGKGSGLGLSMVYGFATQSGGRLEIASEPGVGTTVSIYLPAALQADRAPAVTAQDVTASPVARHILLVEDDDVLRQQVQRQLTRLGYRVTACEDALNDLPEDVRKLLALDLCGYSDGIPHSRMSELVTALAPTCRAVLARAPSLTFKTQDWRGCRLSGISLDCSGLDPGDTQLLARLASFAQDASGVSKTIIGHSLPDRSSTLAALAAGFSHLSGKPIHPDLQRPDAVRWTPSDLYREGNEAAAEASDASPGPQRRGGGAASAPGATAAGEPDVVPWLSALDGVAYLVDADAVVVGAGGGGWRHTNERGPEGPEPSPAALLGRNLFDQISGEDVRGHYRALHKAVIEGIRPQIAFAYRCDAPDIKRTMRMSLGRLNRPGRKPLALYQSQILSAVQRPWMTVFEASRIVEAIRAESMLPIIAVCSVCERIGWPVKAEAGSRAWIEAEEYYIRGGNSDVRVSHTICEPCAHAFSILLAGG